MEYNKTHVFNSLQLTFLWSTLYTRDRSFTKILLVYLRHKIFNQVEMNEGPKTKELRKQKKWT